MKKVLLVFVLSLPIVILGQNKKTSQPHNFTFDTEHKKIYWQKAYEHGSSDEVHRFITSMGCLLTYSDSIRISGSTPENNLRFSKKHTRKRTDDDYFEQPIRPIYNEPCKIYFNIDMKDNRYRVTVTNIIWRSNTSLGLYVTVQAGNLDINNILVRPNGKLRSWAEEGDFIKLHECLDNIFDIRKNDAKILNKEW